MKWYQKLNRFPLGSIRAEGFLKEQLLRGKDGMAGHLYELEPEMIAAPYIREFHVPAWTDTEGTGWGAEIAGNYWAAYIQHAFTLCDEEMIERATQWVDGVLKRQQPDGYLGTYTQRRTGNEIYEDYNAWGTACGMRALLAFYEATGREDVLDAVHRCMLWFCENWDGDQKTTYAGPFIMEPMAFTYFHTGDSKLLRFCEMYTEYLAEHDLFQKSYRAMLEEVPHYNADHVAGMGTTTRLPALLYCMTGKEKYLQASEKRIYQLRERAGNHVGGLATASEFLAARSAVAETEYCSYFFWNTTYEYMSAITGEAKYGDYIEEIFYNGAQGARKKDEKAIAYMSAPNQVYATMQSSNSMDDKQVYAPCYPVACCPVNAVGIVPEFVRSLLLYDDRGDIYAMAYGPCALEHGAVRVIENTLYPFRNQVRFTIQCNMEFGLHLRIPAWADGFTLYVNGSELTADLAENGFAVVRRNWKTGDVLEISFRAQVKVCQLDDSAAAGKYPLVVKYGALVFTYHVPEVWTPVQGRPMTALPAGWNWYEATPDFAQPNEADIHERNGRLKETFSWNIALDETLKATDFVIEERENFGYVWEDAPIRLHTHCYKAPYLWAPYQMKTLEPYGTYQYVTKQLPLVLEPYGCTNLRITYFPKAEPACVKSIGGQR